MNPYAVIQTGGKQYTVKAGDVLEIERISGKNEGDKVEFATLATQSGSDFQVGTPELSGKVQGTIVDETRGDKVTILKNHKRSTYRVKRGHRQNYHAIRIDSIPGN